MPEFLLTKEEIEIARGRPIIEKQTLKDARAINQAALKKVAAYVKQHAMNLPEGSSTRYRHVLYIGAEEWAALMQESGLAEKTERDVECPKRF